MTVKKRFRGIYWTLILYEVNLISYLIQYLLSLSRQNMSYIIYFSLTIPNHCAFVLYIAYRALLVIKCLNLHGTHLDGSHFLVDYSYHVFSFVLGTCPHDLVNHCFSCSQLFLLDRFEFALIRTLNDKGKIFESWNKEGFSSLKFLPVLLFFKPFLSFCTFIFFAFFNVLGKLPLFILVSVVIFSPSKILFIRKSWVNSLFFLNYFLLLSLACSNCAIYFTFMSTYERLIPSTKNMINAFIIWNKIHFEPLRTSKLSRK